MKRDDDPREDMEPAWRAAVLAYREARAGGLLDHVAHLDAVEAVREVRAELTLEEAGREAIAAVAFAMNFVKSGSGDR